MGDDPHPKEQHEATTSGTSVFKDLPGAHHHTIPMAIKQQLLSALGLDLPSSSASNTPFVTGSFSHHQPIASTTGQETLLSQPSSNRPPEPYKSSMISQITEVKEELETEEKHSVPLQNCDKNQCKDESGSFSSETKATPLNEQLTVETKEQHGTEEKPLPSSQHSDTVGHCSKCGRSANIHKEAEETDEDQENKDSHWIQCSRCPNWYHSACVGFAYYENELIDEFHCDECSKQFGPTTMRPFHAPHRFLYYLESQKDLPVEVGSKSWIEDFAKREDQITNATADDVVLCDTGHDFMNHFDENEGEWEKVYLIKNIEGLQMAMPDPGALDLDTIVELFGEDYTVDTIDVYRQITINMKLGEFRRKFNDPNRTKLFNILSLEFSSNQDMTEIVRPPVKVPHISFVHKMWVKPHDVVWGDPIVNPYDLPDDCDQKRWLVHIDRYKDAPEVALFCLCGMAGSYTDYHIDFGGSSVWYHIYQGKKIFYVAPPTEKNLETYKQHQISEQRSENWLGAKLEEHKRVVVDEGNTLMIPSGWIHAVYTPVDSLVFGGNFLHHLNIPMQLKVYDIECEIRKKIGTEEKFLFPQFEYIHEHVGVVWAQHEMREARVNGEDIPSVLIDGARALLEAFKKWDSIPGREIQETYGYQMKDNIKRLEKDIRDTEAYMQERESIRNGTKKSRKKNSDSEDEYDPSGKPKKKKAKKIRKSKGDSAIKDTPSVRLTKLTSPVISVPRNDLELDVSNTPMDVVAPLVIHTGAKCEVVEKELPNCIGQTNVAKMFGRGTSSGRAVRPTQRLLDIVPQQNIDEEARKVLERGEQPAPRPLVLYSKEMDAIMAAEEKEFDLEDKPKSKKKNATQIGKDVQKETTAKTAAKKPQSSTSKQRLAKKLKMKL